MFDSPAPSRVAVASALRGPLKGMCQLKLSRIYTPSPKCAKETVSPVAMTTRRKTRIPDAATARRTAHRSCHRTLGVCWRWMNIFRSAPRSSPFLAPRSSLLAPRSWLLAFPRSWLLAFPRSWLLAFPRSSPFLAPVSSPFLAPGSSLLSCTFPSA